MLLIHTNEMEMFDDDTQEFYYVKPLDLYLEHSLVSISKWESKWHKPFIGNKEITVEETIDYIRCMTINKNIDYETFVYLNRFHGIEIKEYIEDSYTATTFYDTGNRSSGKGEKIITSELIYYWMLAYNIPFECDKWHINRLLTLIKICSIKNSQDKKMSPSAIRKQNASLNAARRRMHNTKG